MVGRGTDVEIDWDADRNEIADQVHRDSDVQSMDGATAKLIDCVRLIEAWVDDHPEHEEIRGWSREILVAALYIENEYSYQSDELRQVEQSNMDILSEIYNDDDSQ